MYRRPPRTTHTNTLLPYTTLVRSHRHIPHQVSVFELADQRIGIGLVLECAHLYVIAAGWGRRLLLGRRINSRRLRHWWRRLNLGRSEEHTSELQSLMRTSYAVLCLK